MSNPWWKRAPGITYGAFLPHFHLRNTNGTFPLRRNKDVDDLLCLHWGEYKASVQEMAFYTPGCHRWASTPPNIIYYCVIIWYFSDNNNHVSFLNKLLNCRGLKLHHVIQRLQYIPLYCTLGEQCAVWPYCKLLDLMMLVVPIQYHCHHSYKELAKCIIIL